MKTLQYLARLKGSRDVREDSRMLDVSSGHSQDGNTAGGILNAYEEVMGVDSNDWISNRGSQGNEYKKQEDGGSTINKGASWMWGAASFVFGGLFGRDRASPSDHQDKEVGLIHALMLHLCEVWWLGTYTCTLLRFSSVTNTAKNG